MPTATAFRFPRLFPFCPSDLSGLYTQLDYVGGLSLADAMEFFWNTNDVQFTFAGTDTHTFGGVLNTASAAGTWKFNPPTVSGGFTNLSTFRYNVGSALAPDTAAGAIGDLPSATRTPVERVCVNFYALFSLIASGPGGGAGTYPPRYLDLQFYLGVDPGDATKYAIYYKILCTAGSYYQLGGVGISIQNPAYPAGNDINQYSSGTFTIGSLTFNFRAYYNYSLTGAAITVSRTAWTY